MWRIAFELGANGFEVFEWVAAFRARKIHHVHKHTGALYVAQETVAQASTFGSPFYKARHIGNNKAAASIHAHHPEVWL